FGRLSTKPARRVGERPSNFGFDQQGRFPGVTMKVTWKELTKPLWKKEKILQICDGRTITKGGLRTAFFIFTQNHTFSIISIMRIH
ncbi:hypothetical protein, partial [Citrobacter freundii]|uniref:hypothetical protein n=1 Tax=Citrobacter freundii TaxID=546 RepID=UPI001BCBA771